MIEPDLPLPAGYPQLLEDLKRTVAAARWRAQRVVNTELVGLYWQLGDAVLQRQQAEGWGARVIDRLATDLRAAFPQMRGLSRSNLFYMRSFASAWPEEAIVQQPVGQLPWGHVTVLLDKLDDQAERDWYAAAAVGNGWSRNVLLNQIMNQLHRRAGAAPSNSPAQLPAQDSELAQQLTRDPYVLDFLDLTGPARRRTGPEGRAGRPAAGLSSRARPRIAFIGRQYRFEVDGDDFAIDLLFFNWAQSRFVVVELKIGRFQPEYAGKLGFYVAWVDANLRLDRRSPTIGILLCAGRNDQVVRYSLAGSTVPLAVADYTYDALPPAARDAVPADNALAAVAGGFLTELTAGAAPDQRGDPAEDQPG